jgi:eukaryotic-like serine/threonine-protein kinase
MKSGFWRTDWFLGLVAAALFALAYAAVLPLQNRLLVRPDWPIYADIAGIALAAAYLVLLLPRQRAVPAATGAALLLAALFLASLDLAALLLLVGYAAFASKQLIAAQRPQAPAADALRYLAVAYQAQGRLIAAWQQFRRVPLSDAVRADLEALALEFEKDGQAGKADEVRRHLQGSPAAETLRPKAAVPSIVQVPAASGKPRIGAFEIEAELGRSEMAIVYLGRDPVLGRQLAIKTLRLEQVGAEGLEEAKALLFSEVRAAGGLSHPNIVTIYDTGEERDVCYIAMEFLRGGDLLRFAEPENLLPVEHVVSIIARVADALGYAHREGVVHHDVRPGNILYDAAADTVKVTDFGIARLGGAPTPYAPPEQLSGAAVDGRSDLYSLGVTLHQLLCGRLPSAPGLIDADVPPGMVEVLERALAKNPAERFQTAEELAGALRAAPLAQLESGVVDFHL